MTYTIVEVGLTESQLHDLARGIKIHLARDKFSGSVAIPLTKAQAVKIATASRGINLKMSGPQQKWLMEHHAESQGEGFFGDVLKAAAPLARKGLNYGIDHLQGMIPTEKLGAFKGIGDAAVGFARGQGDRLLDHLQEKLGGSIGRKAIDKHMGAGWFDQYLLPGLESAAKIAIPLIKGGGVSRHHWKRAIDEHHGAGWFDEYLLPGLETAAKIAVPLLGGSLHAKSYHGAGWFSDYLLPGLETAAKIVTPLITGGSLGEPRIGGGWMPMSKKKSHSAGGLQL